MAKKNVKNNNKNLMIVGGVIILVVIVYAASSYSGLLGTKSFVGSGDKVATSLDCVVSADGTASATLSVADDSTNPLALGRGTHLNKENITWATSDNQAAIDPAMSVTDDVGVARSSVKSTSSNANSVITASFAGDTYSVESKDATTGQDTTSGVSYGASSCEVPVSGK